MNPNKLNIENLISELDSHSLVIPDFQRNYVWGNQQVLKLLDSVYRDWPIGNIILWKPKNKEPRFKELAILKPLKKEYDKQRYYVLDGQQRILSLYLAFTGKTFGNMTNKFFFNPKSQVIEARQRINSGVQLLKDFKESKLKNITGKKLTNYLLNVTVIEEDFDSVVKIFSRLNMQNTPLNSFNLVFAFMIDNPILSGKYRKIYKNLEDLSNRFKIKLEVLMDIFNDRYANDNVYDYIKSNNHLDIQNSFKKYEEEIEPVLDALKKYPDSLKSLDSYKELIGETKDIEKKFIMNQLEKCLDADTKVTMNKDKTKLRFQNENVKDAKLFWQILNCLRESPDWLWKNDTINKNLPEFEKHHIFPKSKNKNDHLFLFTFIHRDTNKELGNKNPNNQISYLLEKGISEKKLQEILERHFIDSEAYKAMQSGNLNAFLQARENSVNRFLVDFILQ